MTRPMHQDAAAAAVLRRTIMVLLLLLLMICLSSFPSVTAECPDECICEEVYVDCTENRLDRIPDRIHTATEELYLHGNNIRDIKPKSFTHLTELRKLSLSTNNISELKNGAFSNLSKLQELFLFQNKIENIETGIFNNLTSLQELQLDDNKIHKLDVEMFKGLTKLERLDLSYNMISNIPPGIFDSLSSLSRLDLRSNKISDIEPLAHVRELKRLYLDYNKIRDIEPLAHLKELEILYLDNNTIRDIESLAQLTALRRLHLSSNDIRDIKPLAHLRKLTRLMLDNNPLTCDCNNLLFVNVVKKSYPQQDVLRYSNPSCHFPLDMREKWLKEITENDFNCTSPDVIVVPENKTVSVGEQLQLSCKAAGDPEPSITWTKDGIDLELGQRVQVFQNNTLMISKVERTDGGQYKCVAFNSFGRKSFEAMVIVNGADI